jgi:predicted ATP-binding protein involved in virulence
MFRLEYLKVIEHPQLGDLELFFTEANEIANPTQFYSTVIIGPNGTGKSYILRTLIDLFRELFELKVIGKRRKYFTGKYNFKYHINGHQYCYSNILESNDEFRSNLIPGGKSWRERGKNFSLHKDGVLVNPDELELPDSILANSIMLTDKYVFLSNAEEFNIYKYLGIRSSRSTSGTRTYIKNTINYLANSNEKTIFINALPRILHFLELEQYLLLSYSVRRREIFFTGELSRETFKKFILDYEAKLDQRRKKESKNITPWYAYQHYKNLLEDETLLDSLIDFCNQKVKNLDKNTLSGKYFFEYDLLEDIRSLEVEFPLISLLEKLNLIGYPELCFRKKGTETYNFEGASSGEAHFLSSMIGILATIKQNSLILIDEPEISLHPNWQMKYMNFLNEILRNYSNCHFIIATHSHFLISDLKGENSKIIGLKREEGKIQNIELPVNLNTYGWSAEDVLYNVFNVASTRNKFVAEDIAKILDKLSIGDKNKVNILPKNIYDEILQLEAALKENDPLKHVVTSILTKVSQ